MLMKMKMGREMALNKIALPITTLNSNIGECALMRILC